MTILWGLKKDGDAWAGGEILDPNDGKIYRCKMKLSDDGKSLNVRGFIGISLIGRTPDLDAAGVAQLTLMRGHVGDGIAAFAGTRARG